MRVLYITSNHNFTSAFLLLWNTSQFLPKANKGNQIRERIQCFYRMSENPLRALSKVKIPHLATRRKVAEWKRWLTTTMPIDMTNISTEGALEGNSTLPLVSIPLELWSAMKSAEGILFDYMKMQKSTSW